MSKQQSQLLPDAYSRSRSTRGIKTLGAYPALIWTRRTLCGKMSSLFLICVSFYIFCAYVTLVASKPDSRSGRQQPTTSDGFALPESAHSWAMYTPYYPLDDYVPPPQDCEIVQVSVVCGLRRSIAIVRGAESWSADVNILQRHGARYPTKSASKAIKKALKKLQGAKKFTDPQMYFLHNFTYSLGKDDLVPFGATESYDAGEQAFWRYADLMSEDKLPFVRASSKQRVVDSATNWTAGFAAASHQQYAPVLSVILSESANDTLDDANCPNAGSADAQDAAWQAVYAPNITAALNAYAPGADLDDDDTGSLMSLCPFETVAKMGRSGFCGLFEQLGAFAGYEYAGDGGGGGVGC
ncbi:hypothetical protein AcV7_002762 [Taiwanofungus camphoratus]|nr:hypothetical protein AcV7_002762 [Antrodia cinnamomea]